MTAGATWCRISIARRRGKNHYHAVLPQRYNTPITTGPTSNGRRPTWRQSQVTYPNERNVNYDTRRGGPASCRGLTSIFDDGTAMVLWTPARPSTLPTSNLGAGQIVKETEAGADAELSELERQQRHRPRSLRAAWAAIQVWKDSSGNLRDEYKIRLRPCRQTAGGREPGTERGGFSTSFTLTMTSAA